MATNPNGGWSNNEDFGSSFSKSVLFVRIPDLCFAYTAQTTVTSATAEHALMDRQVQPQQMELDLTFIRGVLVIYTVSNPTGLMMGDYIVT